MEKRNIELGNVLCWILQKAKVLGICRIACFGRISGNDILSHTDLV